MDERLALCPFCRHEGKLFHHKMNELVTLWWVQCTNTHCLARRTPVDNKEDAIRMWNAGGSGA